MVSRHLLNFKCPIFKKYLLCLSRKKGLLGSPLFVKGGREHG